MLVVQEGRWLRASFDILSERAPGRSVAEAALIKARSLIDEQIRSGATDKYRRPIGTRIAWSTDLSTVEEPLPAEKDNQSPGCSTHPCDICCRIDVEIKLILRALLTRMYPA